MEEFCECKEHQDAKAGRESVDTVDEIHSVDYEQDNKDCERITQIDRNVVNAHETVQIVDAEVAERKYECCGKLYAEFMHGFHAVEVVEYAYEIDEQRTDGEENGRDVDIEVVAYSTKHDGERCRHTYCHRRHEERAS